MERNPEISAAIKSIREELKGFVDVQRKVKQLRKEYSRSGASIPEELRTEMGLGKWYDFASLLHRNRNRITVLLNVYLAIREKEYRHSARSPYAYRFQLQKLGVQYPVLQGVVDKLLQEKENEEKRAAA